MVNCPAVDRSTCQLAVGSGVGDEDGLGAAEADAEGDAVTGDGVVAGSPLGALPQLTNVSIANTTISRYFTGRTAEVAASPRTAIGPDVG